MNIERLLLLDGQRPGTEGTATRPDPLFVCYLGSPTGTPIDHECRDIVAAVPPREGWLAGGRQASARALAICTLLSMETGIGVVQTKEEVVQGVVIRWC